MSRFLLDTHAILWFIEDNEKLSVPAKQAIETEDKVFFSVASLWEIALKKNKGKLNIRRSMLSLSQYLASLGIDVFEVSPVYLDNLQMLPDIHSDPFDRLLIATALSEDCVLITRDENIHKYDVQTLW
ncbi:MAG: type II toxin-antitoxin system VapC family toxin [Coriobacteriales bacterium]|jgi:PIN domain nuclease of toxin-antitoxin system|nr:type II toxin-antitoxin system VapC family toxin [Coriobacteriales bacterium]